MNFVEAGSELQALFPHLTVELGPGLEQKWPELQAQLLDGVRRLERFAGEHGWTNLLKPPLVRKIRIFDTHAAFRAACFQLLSLPAETPFPETYCAALEDPGSDPGFTGSRGDGPGGIFMAVSPSVFAAAVPAEATAGAWGRLFCHEMAHRLHVRLLSGDDEAMGPTWFFEGFACVAAGQFLHAGLRVDRAFVESVWWEKERGDYARYASVTRWLMREFDLPELVEAAAQKGFIPFLKRRLGWADAVIQ